MMLTSPRYEVRPTETDNRPPWCVFDTFAQQWVEDHATKGRAIVAVTALNRAYARAMVDHD
jgi:hypothetical protein